MPTLGLIGILGLGLGGKLLHGHATSGALGPDGSVRPDVDFLQFAEDARTELGDRFAGGIEGRSLVAHLGADAGFFGDLGEQPSFVDGSRERLLGVATDAQSHGLERGVADPAVGQRIGDRPFEDASLHSSG